MRDYSDTTVIAPTLNERENIGPFLRKLTSMYPNILVIVPDDGSVDRTQDEIKKAASKNRNIRFLDRSGKGVHGVTASILDSALLVTTDKIVSMDADFQHPLGKVGGIIAALDRYDMVVGVRTGLPQRGLWRRVMSRTISLIAATVFRLRGKPTCSDMASGFFGIRTKLLKALIASDRSAFVEPGNKTLLDIFRIIGNGRRIGEVGYADFPERLRGKSKMKAMHIPRALMSVFK